jgi:hypothetical protein
MFIRNFILIMDIITWIGVSNKSALNKKHKAG